MAGLPPEGSQFDARQFDAKMDELLGTDGEEFFTSYDEVYDSFDSMGLQENLLRGIYAYGFEKPSAIQQRGIVSFCKGLDVIQRTQSGTGKTATFCSGILQQLDYGLVECQALVLAPTRELAQQIEKVMRALGDSLGVKVHACVGGTSVREDQRILASGVHVVVGTPGRVFDMLRRQSLRPDHIKMFVLDEADEMLSRGFKDQIYDIFRLLPPKSKPSSKETRNEIEKEVETEAAADFEEAEDSLMFKNKSAELKYKDNFNKRTVLCERGIKLEDYSEPPFELGSLFEERNWKNWVIARRTAIVPLVREFYSNAEIVPNKERPTISTKVRGKAITVDPEDFARVGSLPVEKASKYTRRQENQWEEQLKKENLVKLLTGNPQAVWTGARLSKSKLTQKSNVLHMLVCSSMIPQAFRSSVSLEQAVLIGKMLLGIPHNLPHHIWHVVSQVIENPETNSGLPFGGLITDLILQAGVREEIGMERVKPVSLIAGTSVKSSRGQLGKKGKTVEPENVQQPEEREEQASTSQILEEKVLEIQKNQEFLMKEMKELKAGQQRLIRMWERIYGAEQSELEED